LSLIRKHGAVLQAWACLALVDVGRAVTPRRMLAEPRQPNAFWCILSLKYCISRHAATHSQ